MSNNTGEGMCLTSYTSIQYVFNMCNVQCLKYKCIWCKALYETFQVIVSFSKRCNHAIIQLHQIFENLRKFRTNERQPGKTATNIVYLPEGTAYTAGLNINTGFKQTNKLCF